MAERRAPLARRSCSALSADGVGFEPTRLEEPTRAPSVRLQPDSATRPGAVLRKAEGEGFEPSRALGPNALAGRRFKPLSHPSASDRPPRAAAVDWPAWIRTRNLLVQSQACCRYTTGQRGSGRRGGRPRGASPVALGRPADRPSGPASIAYPAGADKFRCRADRPGSSGRNGVVGRRTPPRKRLRGDAFPQRGVNGSSGDPLPRRGSPEPPPVRAPAPAPPAPGASGARPPAPRRRPPSRPRRGPGGRRRRRPARPPRTR